MPYRTKQSWYHVRPGLRDILKEHGITGVSFCLASGIPHATYVVLCHGTPHSVAQFVSGVTRQKVLAGVIATCGEEYRARAEALWDPIPKAEVRINGDKQVQTRLRDLARQHGLTPFEFIAELLKGPRDPLQVLNSCYTGRRKRTTRT